MRTIEADPDFRPVVVLTSNSEKNLPDAFVRRCVFYHIPFPDKAAMLEIAAILILKIMPDRERCS